jgi:CRP-like cAMP-binding protein
MAFAQISVVPPVSPMSHKTQPTLVKEGQPRTETFSHNHMIYRATDPAQRLYMLRAGRVKLLRPGNLSARAVLAILRPGDIFGDLRSVDGATMDEIAIASGEVQVQVLDKAAVDQMLEQSPQRAFEVLSGMNERLRDLRRRVQALTFKDVPARLAETLLSLGETHGERCTHGGAVDLKQITQQDLADLVGASRSFVSTLINEMKRDKLLGHSGRTLCILDKKKLAEIAQVSAPTPA